MLPRAEELEPRPLGAGDRRGRAGSRRSLPRRGRAQPSARGRITAVDGAPLQREGPPEPCRLCPRARARESLWRVPLGALHGGPLRLPPRRMRRMRLLLLLRLSSHALLVPGELGLDLLELLAVALELCALAGSVPCGHPAVLFSIQK